MGLFKKKPAQSAAHVAAGPPPVHVSHWDAARFKIQLRMAKTRIEVQRTKRENSIVTNRRTAADHLRSGKDELARIFTEKLLRERSQIESFDVMMTYVELLIESCQFIGNVRDFDRAPPDVKESVASLVYGAQRMSSVHELQVASQILRTHFGAAIIDPIVRGDDGPHLHCVNSLLAIKLDCTTPDPALVREELIRIANEFNIDWTAPPDTYGSVQPAYAPNMYPPHNPGPNLGGHPPSAPPPPPPGPGDYYGGGGGGGMYAGSSVPPVNPNSIPGLYPPSSVPPSVPPSVPSSMPSLAPMMPPMAPPGGALHSLGPTPPPNAPPHPEHLSPDFLASRFDQLNRGTK